MSLENDIGRKRWVLRGLALLEATLDSPPAEINELDWKGGLSANKDRLTEHLSALSNHPGGGFLAFGINASGIAEGVTGTQAIEIPNRLANIGREGLTPPISIDHTVETFQFVRVLLVHVRESDVKPVQLRGKSIEHAFIRSGGTTRKASRQEIGMLMLRSRTPHWEELYSSVLLTDAELIDSLDADALLQLLARPAPSGDFQILEWLSEEKFVVLEATGGGYVTNLGAMSAANRLSDFGDLSRKAVRVIVYDGLNKVMAKQEREGQRGYAVSFESLLRHIESVLPQSEVIERALRRKLTVYPEIALREIVANALIHQDFSIQGAGPLVEVFDNRIEISNPGGLLPSKTLDRLIGTQPESRNELLARAFRRYKICEERGSGLVKAGAAVELYGLPPIEFFAGSNFFRVTLHAPRTYAQMTSNERLQACYQHAVLRHLSDSAMTNQTLRERLKMPERHRSAVSQLIQEAIAHNLIKNRDPDNKSKKFAGYLPYWA